MSDTIQKHDIETCRLIIRCILQEDAERINQLQNDRAIADTTCRIPHPCSLEHTQKWIKGDLHSGGKDSGFFTIILKKTDELIGVIGLEIDKQHDRAELGFWIGKMYWGEGYCTEAARAIIKYGFEQLRLHRIYTLHFAENISSGRVLQKAGMQHEGSLKKHLKKGDVFKDLEYYGLISEDYMTKEKSLEGE